MRKYEIPSAVGWSGLGKDLAQASELQVIRPRTSLLPVSYDFFHSWTTSDNGERAFIETYGIGHFHGVLCTSSHLPLHLLRARTSLYQGTTLHTDQKRRRKHGCCAYVCPPPVVSDGVKGQIGVAYLKLHWILYVDVSPTM